ncbi:MAG TPA: hypothetical protein VF185_00670 [Patescibacteria group bacterium]
MERIRFFDASISQHMGRKIPANTEVTVQEVLHEAKDLNPQVFRSENFIQDFNNWSIDPLARAKTQKWEMAVGTVMYAISGQIPDRADVLRGRQIIDKLPKAIKADLDLHFTLSYLPYLLVGFNIDPRNVHVDEANKIDNAVAFILETYNTSSVTSLSFLCAHRELTVRKPMSLVSELAGEKIKKTVNLQLGIFCNANIDGALLLWKQQEASEKAGSNMFPDMFINYMTHGQISDMLLLLDSHFQQMKVILEEKNTDKVKILLEGQDEYSSQLEQELSRIFHANWKYSPASDNCAWPNKLLSIAEELTIHDIDRLKPYFEVSKENEWKSHLEQLIDKNLARARTLEAEGQKLSSGKPLSDLTEAAIKWFSENQGMTFSAKSLYETLFYFYWGQQAAKNKQVGVGIDRDYSSFQTAAWEAGYCMDSSKRAPILYARRIDDEKAGGRLREISYRQFWRK